MKKLPSPRSKKVSTKPKSRSRTPESASAAAEQRDAIATSSTGEENANAKNADRPIVAIGCSAGGLEPLTALIKEVSSSTDLSFVCMQHLGPQQEEQLAELLRRATTMPVVEAADGMEIGLNQIYVVSSHTPVGILNRRFVFERSIDGMKSPSDAANTNATGSSKRFRMPIDELFASIADDVETCAVGIVLSGTGSDGARGIAKIKAAGGITFAQDRTAAYSGMPEAAMSTGQVDFVLPPAGIAHELQRVAQTPYVRTRTDVVQNDVFKNQEDLNRIFLILRSATGVDFSAYKDNTIKRRIFRRMVLARIDTLSDYLRYLSQTPSEVQILHDDFLINVTSFFRDPETFEALKEKVFPHVLARTDRSVDMPTRIWVPACSTGEEPYSIAIALIEYLNAAGLEPLNIQIFATDLSDAAITKARKGFYLPNIAQEVSPERLRTFFKKVEGGYQIAKAVRDLCIFAKQNMMKDPPFSRLDLISCRNVLIYLSPAQQKLVMRTFHQALLPDGFLMLGTSETIGPSVELFHLLDKKNKIYAKKGIYSRGPLPVLGPIRGTVPSTNDPMSHSKIASEQAELRSSTDLQREADRLVLARHSPPGVIIDEDFEIVQFRGQTSEFLEPAPGLATLNLLRMAREGLKLPLRTIVASARKQNRVVRKQGVSIVTRTPDGQSFVQYYSIEAIPIRATGPKQNFVLVLFDRESSENLKQADTSNSGQTSSTKGNRAVKALEEKLRAVEQELADTKEDVRRNLEDQDAYLEELKSANEEIQSSNEELQSTNEELETAKEELQSINEELTTLNDELHLRNIELSQVNNDLQNLLANVNFSIVMVGVDHRIRRFNPMAERVLNLIQTDIGRPITDINPSIQIESFDRLLTEVIDSLKVINREVKDSQGRWYALTMRPYKTGDNKIDGAVIVLVDIDEFKKSVRTGDLSRDAVTLLKELASQPIAVLGADGTIETANEKFWDYVGSRPLDGRKIVELIPGLNSANLESLLQSGTDEGFSSLILPMARSEDRTGQGSTLELLAQRISTSSSEVLLSLRLLEAR